MMYANKGDVTIFDGKTRRRNFKPAPKDPTP